MYRDHDDNVRLVIVSSAIPRLNGTFQFKSLNWHLNLEIEEAEYALALESRMLADIGCACEPDPSRSPGLVDSEVHSNVLGGGIETASALEPIDEETRKRVAQVELERQLREEQEMEDHCGSDGPAALK